MKNRKGDLSRPAEMQCKGNDISLKNKILSVLKEDRCTAIMLNQRFCFNDARKVISDLRGDGHTISDYRLADRRKVYFLKKSKQLELFPKGGAI